jgi:hypothetical protein
MFILIIILVSSLVWQWIDRELTKALGNSQRSFNPGESVKIRKMV